MARPKRTIAERFWPKVQRSVDGCWPWLSKISARGYGVFYLDAARPNALAHRASWEIHNGPIPDGMVICHRCDNPPCVRPGHLFLGTTGDNVRDAHQKGRGATHNAVPRTGEDHHSAKLTRAQVQEIIVQNDGIRGTQKRLAVKYGVSDVMIRKIWRGESWKHLQEPLETRTELCSLG